MGKQPEILRWFEYGHLPEALQKRVSIGFAQLAEAVASLPAVVAVVDFCNKVARASAQDEKPEGL